MNKTVPISDLLKAIDGLEHEKADTLSRRDTVTARIRELTAKHDDLNEATIPLYTQNDPGRVDSILAGEAEISTRRKDIEAHERHNADLMHQIGQIDADIRLLNQEKVRCDDKILAISRNIKDAESSFFSALTTVLVDELNTILVDDLEPLIRTLEEIIRLSSSKGGGNGAVLGALGHMTIGTIESGVFKQFYPHFGRKNLSTRSSFDPQQAVNDLIEKIRDQA